ncbi:hypothetical protein HZS_2717 [Henneguya salminicola]|nr:hypothetical protein HZS_2717 [Henneguya salminicola]
MLTFQKISCACKNCIKFSNKTFSIFYIFILINFVLITLCTISDVSKCSSYLIMLELIMAYLLISLNIQILAIIMDKYIIIPKKCRKIYTLLLMTSIEIFLTIFVSILGLIKFYPLLDKRNNMAFLFGILTGLALCYKAVVYYILARKKGNIVIKKNHMNLFFK